MLCFHLCNSNLLYYNIYCALKVMFISEVFLALLLENVNLESEFLEVIRTSRCLITLFALIPITGYKIRIGPTVLLNRPS